MGISFWRFLTYLVRFLSLHLTDMTFPSRIAETSEDLYSVFSLEDHRNIKMAT